MARSVPVGMSLPTTIIEKIDQERGDIPRSKYVLRILEGKYVDTGTTSGNKLRKQDSPNEGFEGQTLSESRSP